MKKEKLNDKYFGLITKRNKEEEIEDDLRLLKKNVHAIKSDANAFLKYVVQVKDNENDILGSDYANEIGMINDELFKNVKDIQYQVEKYEDEVNKQLKKNEEKQKLIQEKMIKLKKEDVREDD